MAMRRLTRIRRFRYYPLRIVDGRIEVALPPPLDHLEPDVIADA